MGGARDSSGSIVPRGVKLGGNLSWGRETICVAVVAGVRKTVAAFDGGAILYGWLVFVGGRCARINAHRVALKCCAGRWRVAHSLLEQLCPPTVHFHVPSC